MTTYSAYQRQGDGTVFRLGTFRAPRGSVRIVTAAFVKLHPSVDVSTIEFARRMLVNGRHVDAGVRVQAEL